jgi:hypothetical protein
LVVNENTYLCNTRLIGNPKMLSVNTELAALFARMRQRFYPETLPVFLSYWLKTVCARGYEFRWWRRLQDELTQSPAETVPDWHPFTSSPNRTS